MQPTSDLAGKRVLVTGGTGFIGSRLVERLVLEHGARVRVPVRAYARATRVARYPVELMPLDFADHAQIEAVAKDCDVVVHCAYGSEGNEDKMRVVSVEGTKRLIEAAQRNKATRFVHVSTINVYGATPDGPLDETAPRQFPGDAYSNTKLEGENVAMEMAAAGAPVTVVQPTIVYGPYGPAWTTRILNDMKTGRVPLINGGDGVCNAVYVDDLVSGMLLAATVPEAIGQCFLLSGPEPTTWQAFYGEYERMLGETCTVPIDADAAKADFQARFGSKRRSVVREVMSILRHERKVRQRVLGSFEGQALRKAARFVVPQPVRRAVRQKVKGGGNHTAPAAATATACALEEPRPVHPMAPPTVDYQACKTAVQIDKARRLLGYEPKFNLASGMQRTEQWARWAGLLN